MSVGLKKNNELKHVIKVTFSLLFNESILAANNKKIEKISLKNVKIFTNSYLNLGKGL